MGFYPHSMFLASRYREETHNLLTKIEAGSVALDGQGQLVVRTTADHLDRT